MRLRALPEVPGSMLESDTSELHSAPANERNIQKWPAFTVRRVARMKSAKWCGGLQSLARTVCLPSSASHPWNLKMRRSTESRPPPLHSVRCVAPKESKGLAAVTSTLALAPVRRTRRRRCPANVYGADAAVYRLAVSSFTGIHRVSHERHLACKPRAATLPQDQDLKTRPQDLKIKTSRPGLKTSRPPQDLASRLEAARLAEDRRAAGHHPRQPRGPASSSDRDDRLSPVLKSLGIPASASSILLRNKPRRAAPCKPHVQDPQDLKTWRQDLAARHQDIKTFKTFKTIKIFKTFKAIKTVKTQDHQDFKTKNQAVQDIQVSTMAVHQLDSVAGESDALRGN
ncbi:hypothetical protein B0H11DRAFT_1918085 [Mycena galericulata]|nr:hypothetical protein B0H11DRAFT_1918085 [Mycena galericulata]